VKKRKASAICVSDPSSTPVALAVVESNAEGQSFALGQQNAIESIVSGFRILPETLLLMGVAPAAVLASGEMFDCLLWLSLGDAVAHGIFGIDGPPPVCPGHTRAMCARLGIQFSPALERDANELADKVFEFWNGKEAA
jgi:hypothetical protein